MYDMGGGGAGVSDWANKASTNTFAQHISANEGNNELFSDFVSSARDKFHILAVDGVWVLFSRFIYVIIVCIFLFEPSIFFDATQLRVFSVVPF